MRKYILLCILFTFFYTLSYSQNKLYVNFGYGTYLENSENALKVMGDKKFRSHLVYGFIYQREDVMGFNLMIEYAYNRITKEDVMEFARTGSNSPEIIDIFGGDAVLINHTFDLDYLGEINKYLSYGIGPSFIITNRIIDVDETLYDKLASSGLGLNGLLEFSIPLASSESEDYFFFTSKLKFRYTYSVWFDEGIRKLDDYYQEFLSTQFSIGLGYSF